MKFKATGVLIIFCAAVLLSGYGTQSSSALEDLQWDYEINFDDKEEVLDNFLCHFVSTQNARRVDEFDFTWAIEDGKLVRKNNVDMFSDTVNIAILTFYKEVYEDFELSVDYFTGSKTTYWPVVAIRQQIPGKYYTTPGGGCGIFMQQNGKITLWGEIVNGLMEEEIDSASDYCYSRWHNLRIRAVGSVAEIFVDGASVKRVSVNSTDYRNGYVSLQSVNNDCAFDNFRIRNLYAGNSTENEPNKYGRKDEGVPLDGLVK